MFNWLKELAESITWRNRSDALFNDVYGVDFKCGCKVIADIEGGKPAWIYECAKHGKGDWTI